MKKHVKGFSPLYVGGEDWFTALGFVFDYGGSIAKRPTASGVGTLDSKKSLAGLKRFKAFFSATQSKSDGDARRERTRSRTPSSRRARTAANYGPALVHVLHRQEVHEGRRRSS